MSFKRLSLTLYRVQLYAWCCSPLNFAVLQTSSGNSWHERNIVGSGPQGSSRPPHIRTVSAQLGSPHGEAERHLSARRSPRILRMACGGSPHKGSKRAAPSASLDQNTRISAHLRNYPHKSSTLVVGVTSAKWRVGEKCVVKPIIITGQPTRGQSTTWEGLKHTMSFVPPSYTAPVFEHSKLQVHPKRWCAHNQLREIVFLLRMLR
jgi:hypothetical protein